MKKMFFIAVLFVIGFVSCTKDTEDLQLKESAGANSMRVGLTLQDLHDDMLRSDEYLDFNISLKAFNLKMGDDSLDENFEDETEMLDWIDINLSKTTFSSFNDASTQWENVKQKFELVIDKNPDLFGNEWDEEEWDGLIIPVDDSGDEQYEAYSDDPCIFGCINAAEVSRKAAESAYKSRMQFALERAVFFGDAAGGALIALNAMQIYSMDQSRIKKNLKTCSCGCNPIFC